MQIQRYAPRLTAYPVLVKDIGEGSFVRGDFERGEAAFVESNGERFSRVCVCVTISSSPTLTNAGFIECTCADETGSFMVRCPADGALNGFNKGESVFLIGRLRESTERFLFVESAHPATQGWLHVHQLRCHLRRLHAFNAVK